MSTAVSSLLKNKLLNRWYLFWLISLPITVLVILEMLSTDMSQGEGVSHMIGYAVRFAIPVIFLIVATSALQTLFPNAITNWLMRNRKYIGLIFAVAMFWQGVFIAMVSIVHRDYYFSEIYLFRDELEGTIGYILLAAMVVTSFYFARKQISKTQWDLIHKSGMYFLWAYPFSTYWWSTTYGPAYYSLHYYIFYWMGLLAMLARIAAWSIKRSRKLPVDNQVSTMNSITAKACIAAGIIAAATPMFWQQAATTALTAAPWSAELVLWLPFWPFEPFLPLLLILFGAYRLSKRY